MGLQNLAIICYAASFALGITLESCNSPIYDNMEDCPQGVYVKFYSMTPCARDSSFVGEVAGLYLFAFNEKDVLQAVELRERAVLNNKFEILMPLNNGYYTFIGWAGVTDLFSVSDFKPSLTTKKDVMLALKSRDKQAQTLGNHRLWQGKSTRGVLLEDPAKVGSQYKRAAVNLQEVTNRVNVEVELHESVTNNAAPQDFVVEISSANGVINIDGSMPLNGEVLNYRPVTSYTYNGVKASFSLMDLKSGYNSAITVRNVKKNEVIWAGDLIGSVLLKNPNVNLACQRDFDVKFVIKDKCVGCESHVCWAIYVDNWQIHSYEVELDISERNV